MKAWLGKLSDKDREKYKADGRRYPSDLTDAEWDIIKPLFTGYFTFTADMREVVNGCFYLEHTGCPWRSSPDRLRCASDGTHVGMTGSGPTACGRMPPPS